MSRRTFLNARSPLRLLEKGLHGGLGIGNIGLLLAGKGVGKTPFLVGVALDEAMRGGDILHVALDQTVVHVKAHYDAVFEEFAASKQLEDAVARQQELDKQRSIRAYPPAGFSASKLREAAKLEAAAGNRPTLILLEGVDLAAFDREELAEVKALAGELGAEVWISVTSETEVIRELPASVKSVASAVSVILALEPEPETGAVKLRALKDHENTDLSALHVSLDPKTLLLVRS